MCVHWCLLLDLCERFARLAVVSAQYLCKPFSCLLDSLLTARHEPQVAGSAASVVESKASGGSASGKEQRPLFLNEFSSLLHGSDKFSDCVFVVKGSCCSVHGLVPYASWSLCQVASGSLLTA